MHHLSLLNDVIKGYNKKTALVGSKEKIMGLGLKFWVVLKVFHVLFIEIFEILP